MLLSLNGFALRCGNNFAAGRMCTHHSPISLCWSMQGAPGPIGLPGEIGPTGPKVALCYASMIQAIA